MAVETKKAREAQPAQSGAPQMEYFGRLLQEKRRELLVAAAAVVLVGGGIWFAQSAKSRREAFATRALQDAKAAIAAGNIPLAASDLSRLVATYGGTSAAGEAALLLAQIRLGQQQPEQAIEELRRYLESDPPDRFRAAAYNLLGAAYEQAGRMKEAAEAYERSSSAWPYAYLKAQVLLDAARAYSLSGDTASAVAAYERIIREFSEAPSALEAKLRLGEIRPTG
ncbi:Outer membrane protein assembly factor BamD [bacterium HR33]|nr:Outer membrane protein assembly factor BamD [bacterium HR33]